MKEWAKIYGNVDSTIKMPDGSSEMTTMNGRVVLSMYKKALDGSTKAAEFLAKLLGEYNINITMDEAKEVRPEINIE